MPPTDPSLRRGRPRRVQRARHGRPRRPATALELTEAHRFPNRPVRTPDGLRWDILALYAGVLDGLRARPGRSPRVGIDSWAVDYGLLDADGALLGNPVHYRDTRTEGVAEKVWAQRAGRRAVRGDRAAVRALQHAVPAGGGPRTSAQLARAERLLLIPDLLTYWLTGEPGTELTNASTTQLIDPRTARLVVRRRRAARHRPRAVRAAAAARRSGGRAAAATCWRRRG